MSQQLLDYMVTQIYNIVRSEAIAENEAIVENEATVENGATVENQAIVESKLNFERPMVMLKSQYWTEPVVRMLKEDEQLQFDFLSCLSGVDYEDHMEVVYQLYSITLDHYAMIKVTTDRQQPEVFSVSGFWSTANWHERETYDLLGIRFAGHPNLTRILLDDQWSGHPLRKDYQMPDCETEGNSDILECQGANVDI